MTDDRMQPKTSEGAARELAKASQHLAQALSEAHRDVELAPALEAGEKAPAAAAAITPQAAPPASAPPPASKRGPRRIGRALARPVRRLLDARFLGLARQIDEKQIDLFDRLDRLRDEDLRLNHEQVAGQSRIAALVEQELAASYSLSSGLNELHRLVETQKEIVEETAAVLGASLAGMRSDTDASAATLERLSTELTEIRSAGAGALLVGANVDRLDEGTARLLDYAGSHTGFAAQRSLWFNPPIALRYDPGSVEVAGVNERIAEVPFVFRALSQVAPGSSILDVGATESAVSLSLASLGYSVTAIDPRPYPMRHPNLEVVVGEAQRWSADRVFDAIVCLSTIEHVGLGAYGDQRESGRPDLGVMSKLRELSRPETVLVLTTRFGQASTGWLERTYDADGIRDLLEGWKVEESVVIRRRDQATWVPDTEAASPPGGEAVIMIVARLAA